jgi:hypothetical protein
MFPKGKMGTEESKVVPPGDGRNKCNILEIDYKLITLNFLNYDTIK